VKITVSAMLVNDVGDPVWGFHKEEVVISPTREEELPDHVLDTGRKILDYVDEAKTSISGQLAAFAAGMNGER